MIPFVRAMYIICAFLPLNPSQNFIKLIHHLLMALTSFDGKTTPGSPNKTYKIFLNTSRALTDIDLETFYDLYKLTPLELRQSNCSDQVRPLTLF